MAAPRTDPDPLNIIPLPAGNHHERLSLTEALRRRRTQRSFAPLPLTLEEIGALLWAAQGSTGPDGLRTAPSAGALYPLELLLVASAVESLPAGSYRYLPLKHQLQRLAPGEHASAVAAAAHGQGWMAEAAAILAFSTVPARTTGKYGHRGERYIHIEVGHAAQNAALEAAVLGLGCGEVGAFDDAAMAVALGLPAGEQPLYLLPVGRLSPETAS